MYRWVDENGVTVYSQTPPPAADAVKLKATPPPRAEDAEAARKRLEQQRERVFDEGEARKEAKAEQEKRAKEAQTRHTIAANCEAAKKNLETLQNLGNRMVHTPDGRYLRLSEDEVRTQIEKARRQVKEFCK
jgi:phage protein D